MAIALKAAYHQRIGRLSFGICASSRKRIRSPPLPGTTSLQRLVLTTTYLSESVLHRESVQDLVFAVGDGAEQASIFRRLTTLFSERGD
jgi:hypothetical protein